MDAEIPGGTNFYEDEFKIVFPFTLTILDRAYYATICFPKNIPLTPATVREKFFEIQQLMQDNIEQNLRFPTHGR